MHIIEPFYRWENLYTADSDERSPFYGRQYDWSMCRNDVYGYYIHPAWDEFGSETLYLKIIYVDYKHRFAIIEFIGEWNDAIHNDVSYLKRNLIDFINREGIIYYILIGENVLNFHGSDDCYYEEWYEDIEDEGGWICAIGFRDHVIEEWKKFNVDSYINYGGSLELTHWRTMHPLKLFQTLKADLQRRLGA
ncbi:MAG: hypothetical protein RMJ87_13545 [Cytophagales bacterium]|nr:hypothetical protein [Bernardetiaceae bacterium]MDW8206046.1 hypothetical protein [Cytophagales bacterium]